MNNLGRFRELSIASSPFKEAPQLSGMRQGQFLFFKGMLQSDDFYEEDEYVVFHLPEQSKDAEKLLRMTSIARLDTPNPLIKVGNQIYQAEYKKLVGTELIFNAEADFIGSASRGLYCRPVQAVKKQ